MIVDGKDAGGKLTKADFVHKYDCSACRMTKTTAPWVRQKAAGYTADGNAQMVLKRTIICEECYARQSGVCASAKGTQAPELVGTCRCQQKSLGR